MRKRDEMDESPVEGDQQFSEMLSDFARTILTDFPVEAILGHLVQRIVDVLPISAAGVTLISGGADPFYVAASDASALQFEQLQSELGEGPCLAAYETGDAVSVPDLQSDEQFPVFGPRALEIGLRAVFTFPLREQDKRLGALDLYRDEPGPLDDRAMASAQTLADVASAYILNARSRAELQVAANLHLETSLHDALTGLPNRVLLRDRLDHAMLRARRSRKTLAVLFADLDRFKQVNDHFGHHVGDELLVAVGNRLTGVLRPGDTLARASGDEFVILCEDLADERQADTIATRICAALAEPYTLSRGQVHVTASIGIAFAWPGDTAEQILHNADVAMYQAKRRGGHDYVVVDLVEQHMIDERTTLEHDLHGASVRGELRLDYQPIVDSADGRPTGVEALLRWDHPQRGVIAPNVLIPLAEQSGLISQVGGWVLEQSCRDRGRWRDELRDPMFRVSVNVSVNQLFARDFYAAVYDVLLETETDPELLTLEVTESVFVADGARALVVLNELRRIGVRLALDDFGTGYSSLSYLRQFPFDIIKIDQTFVADIGLAGSSDAILGAIVTLGHALGITVVAEGVETAKQRQKLVELGCDSCQGYFFARPMSAEKLAGVMTQGGNLGLPMLSA
jgi:diguanylate cyclase (GGDEF)-like protein